MANIKHSSIIKIKDRTLFDVIKKDLIKYGMVKITGFGVFRIKEMKSHSRYIPGSKKVEEVGIKYKLIFIPTKTLKEDIQNNYGK